MGSAAANVKSVVLTGGGGSQRLRSELSELPTPEAGKGEIIVRMEACGLCGTDLEKMRGEYTASMPVLGHEAVGVVSAVGDGVGGFKVGDRVFPHHHVPDYECYFCRSGNETMCEMYRASNLDPGGFSESFRVPKWNVDKGGVLQIPSELSFDHASLIEPLACCIRAVRSNVKVDETVLISGAGPVGLMHALLLEPMGVKILISDVSPWRLEFAEKLGVGVVLDATKDDIPSRAKEESKGRGADLAMVASGSKDAIMQGLNSIRRGGRVCLFGVPRKGSVLGYDVCDLYNSGQQIVTSYGATEKDTREAMGLLSGGEEFSRLITHKFPLSKFGEAVEVATGGQAMKVVLTP